MLINIETKSEKRDVPFLFLFLFLNQHSICVMHGSDVLALLLHKSCLVFFVKCGAECMSSEEYHEKNCKKTRNASS